MSDSISHLMKTVYQHFLDLYQQSANESATRDIFLAFEPIGRTIDSDSYKLHPQDTEFFPAKAIEEFTELTDDVPLINADVFYRTQKSVEETYGSFILHGATPGTSDQGEVDLFNHLKAASKQTFEDVKLGKFSQTGIEYRPSYAKPQDWYNSTQTDNWTSYTYRMKDEQSSSSQRKTFDRPVQRPSGRFFIKPNLQRWQWQVLPLELTPVLSRPQIIQHVSVDATVINHAVKAELNQAITAPVIHPNRARLKQPNRLRRAVNSPQVLPRSLTRPSKTSLSPTLTAKSHIQQAQSERIISKAILSEAASQQISVSATASQGRKTTTILSERDQRTAVSQVMSPALINSIRQQIDQSVTSVKTVASQPLQASAMAVLLESAHTQSVESKELSVSFEYCLVDIDRPWLSHTLLQTKGWYVPGYESGELSKGTADDNTGILPALPIAFIVVKDLKISGWNQSEQKHVEDSVALGPFSLLDRKIDGTSLTWSGMQIIGWISQVMPLMPPMSDPNTN